MGSIWIVGILSATLAAATFADADAAGPELMVELVGWKKLVVV